MRTPTARPRLHGSPTKVASRHHTEPAWLSVMRRVGCTMTGNYAARGHWRELPLGNYTQEHESFCAKSGAGSCMIVGQDRLTDAKVSRFSRDIPHRKRADGPVTRVGRSVNVLRVQTIHGTILLTPGLLINSRQFIRGCTGGLVSQRVRTYYSPDQNGRQSARCWPSAFSSGLA